MPESDAAPPGDTSLKYPLDKPLHLLTEDDIDQVTREDCRRYLREKGMRRPSWNKSQAIEQVIMLKSLLETPPDGGAGSQKRLRISVPSNGDNNANSISESVPKGTRYEMGNFASEAAHAPYQSKDLNGSDSLGGFSGRFAAANNESAQPRNPGSTNMSVGQMSIFYCGRVNVYEDVPADKAQDILHIAGSPQEFSQEHPVDGTMSLKSGSHISNVVSTTEYPGSAVLWPPFLAGATIPECVEMRKTPLVRRPLWNAHQPKKHQCRDTLRKEKTGSRARENKEQSHVHAWSCTADHQILIRIGTCSPIQITPSSTPTL